MLCTTYVAFFYSIKNLIDFQMICQYTVQDNGIGIDLWYHEKIYGLFDKLDPNTEGAGVGLALVKRIIEFHGGQIWVESDGKGEGPAFYLTLT